MNANRERQEAYDDRRSAQGQPSDGAVVIESEQLFAERNEVQIRHAGEIYRLRVTRNGKLILNK